MPTEVHALLVEIATAVSVTADGVDQCRPSLDLLTAMELIAAIRRLPTESTCRGIAIRAPVAIPRYNPDGADATCSGRRPTRRSLRLITALLSRAPSLQ